MDTTTLGPLTGISRLTLGGGGIGALWGPTSREEGIATLREAPDLGITLIDSAPGYNVCEELIGEAFAGTLPTDMRITTKCGLGSIGPDDVYDRLKDSLTSSLTTMRLDHVDVFFLHNPIYPQLPIAPEDQRGWSHWHTDWEILHAAVIPAFERLVGEGLTRHWGVTGIDVPTAIIDLVNSDKRPAIIQAISNLLDSAGALTDPKANARPRDIIAAAGANGVGVMGIRAVQAGALTASFDRDLPDDHADLLDFPRAAPFRALCQEWGEDPAIVAHRYALAMDGVDTVVLGVKNREEMRQIVAAEATGPLSPDQVTDIDNLGLRT